MVALCRLPSPSHQRLFQAGFQFEGAVNANSERRRPCVLVVEDEVLIRAYVCQYLRDHNCRVIEASTAVEAQAIFDVGEMMIDLVCCDASLPGRFDAEDLAAWVRRKFPEVKMLVTSTAAYLSAHTARMPVGDGPVLHKPYSPDVLLANIARLLAE